VSRLVSRAEPGTSNVSDIVFVAEKPDQVRPLQYELVFAGNAFALQKAIDKVAQRGYWVKATWATTDRMSVLLAKPIDGAWDRAQGR
jgi:hypothetical protein